MLGIGQFILFGSWNFAFDYTLPKKIIRLPKSKRNLSRCCGEETTLRQNWSSTWPSSVITSCKSGDTTANIQCHALCLVPYHVRCHACFYVRCLLGCHVWCNFWCHILCHVWFYVWVMSNVMSDVMSDVMSVVMSHLKYDVMYNFMSNVKFNVMTNP